MTVVPIRREGPATVRDWLWFFAPLAGHAQVKLGPEDYEHRCEGFWFAMPDMPASVLSPDRQRESLTEFQFVPTPAEVFKWLKPAMEAARRYRMPAHPALAAPVPEPRAERTQAEIDYVRSRVQLYMAQRPSQPAAHDPAPPVQPRYLTDTQLLASLRAQRKANPTAIGLDGRIAGLEAKIRAAQQPPAAPAPGGARAGA